MSLESRLHNIEQCNRCSQCKFVHMPKSREFSSVCPSIDFGQFHAYSGGGKVISAFGYHKNVIEASPKMIDSVYACTMCGACDTLCKSHMGDNVEPFDTILEFRAQLAADGLVPEQLAGLVKQLEQEGTPFGVRADRSLWAAGHNVVDVRDENVEVLLHIGSNNAYDKSQWGNLRLLVKLLNKAGINFGIAYESESDCGGLAYELGYRDVAAKLATQWSEIVTASRAKALLCADAESFASFKNIYPRLGMALDSVDVLHTTEYIEQLLATGQLSLELKGTGKVTYHDSCKMGRRSEHYTPWEGEYIRVLNTMAVTDSPRKVNYGNDGNYDAPRNLLGRVAGLDVVELERTRQYSYCCGGGCGVKENYPEMAEMAANNCLTEAASAGAEILVTASPNCQLNMAAVAEKNNSTVKVSSLFEILEQSMQEDS